MEFYRPFRKIEEIEKYFNKQIKSSTYGILTVVGCTRGSKTGLIKIQSIDENGNEINMSSLDYFYVTTYSGHPFGEVLEENE